MSARPPCDLLAAAHAPASAIATLIPIDATRISGVAVPTTNARDLYAFLGIGKDFSTWTKAQIARARLVEGRDFISSPSRGSSGQHTIEYHLTLDAGKHVAMLSETEKGFEVREYFIECERRALSPATADPLASLPAEQRALISVMVDNANIKARQDHQARVLADQAKVQARHGAALTTVEQRVDEIAAGQVFTVCPSNAESITPIRARINKKYGLPTWVIDQVMAQMPYSLKPAGTVLNGHELARGAKYSIYWIRDVSAIFTRFVEECERTTDHRARHPFIEGDFKLGPGWGRMHD